MVCWALAAVTVVFFSGIATALHGSTGDGRGVFQRGDQLAMIGLGVLIAAGILLFTRPAAVADERGIRIRNVVGGYDLPWSVVRAVCFDRGASWASLELVNDDTVTILALQSVDREYAVAGVRALRALHAASSAPQPVPESAPGS
ncbi:PH domain-containing protein [Rhizomonospora bruguierae]|uniref:PH domain-containing protein n=1 Tax=Rhizomonospora bruguierae TaxID=1581705 RepID=UPI001BCB89F7|nr:PH domain-containing protein [Micromonospora sp. NBRC 107566]